MSTVLLLIFLGVTAFGLFFYSDRLSKKEIENTQDMHFQPLIDELKSIDSLKFKTVSSEIIYSKTISAFLKATGYFLLATLAGLTLDILTGKSYDTGDLLFDVGFYFVGYCIVFVLPLLSFLWSYTYFKYGASDQIKNAHIIFDYIKPITTKILSKYPIVFVLSYLAGRLLIGSGLMGALSGTIIYAFSVSIYFSLEAKRLGFAPLLNLISEKTKLFQGSLHGKQPQE